MLMLLPLLALLVLITPSSATLPSGLLCHSEPTSVVDLSNIACPVLAPETWSGRVEVYTALDKKTSNIMRRVQIRKYTCETPIFGWIRTVPGEPIISYTLIPTSEYTAKRLQDNNTLTPTTGLCTIAGEGPRHTTIVSVENGTYQLAQDNTIHTTWGTLDACDIEEGECESGSSWYLWDGTRISSSGLKREEDQNVMIWLNDGSPARLVMNHGQAYGLILYHAPGFYLLSGTSLVVNIPDIKSRVKRSLSWEETVEGRHQGLLDISNITLSWIKWYCSDPLGYAAVVTSLTSSDPSALARAITGSDDVIGIHSTRYVIVYQCVRTYDISLRRTGTTCYSATPIYYQQGSEQHTGFLDPNTGVISVDAAEVSCELDSYQYWSSSDGKYVLVDGKGNTLTVGGLYVRPATLFSDGIPPALPWPRSSGAVRPADHLATSRSLASAQSAFLSVVSPGSKTHSEAKVSTGYKRVLEALGWPSDVPFWLSAASAIVTGITSFWGINLSRIAVTDLLMALRAQRIPPPVA